MRLEMKCWVFLLLLMLAGPVVAVDGMRDIESTFTVTETADRLEILLNERGMTIFNRIHHAEAAGRIGVSLRDTELVIFGNPKVGSPLMACAQRVAIDLPQKALIWKGEDGQVLISYNDPSYLAARHGIRGCDPVLLKVSGVLEGLMKAAAGTTDP